MTELVYDLKMLRALDVTDHPAPRAEVAQAFTRWFEAQARARPDAARAWLATHEIALQCDLKHLGHLMTWTERLFEEPWYDGAPWIAVCLFRSFIAQLIAMSSEPEWWIDELDMDEYDDALRLRGHGDGGIEPDEIPAGMPTSHWWWWLPAAPSA